MTLKQIIIVPTDLNMSPGKVAAQVAHASVQNVVHMLESNNHKWLSWIYTWLNEGYTKIVLQTTVKERDSIYNIIKNGNHLSSLDLPVSLIEDLGFTELEPYTKTTLAIGPAPADLIDDFTKELSLYK